MEATAFSTTTTTGSLTVSLTAIADSALLREAAVVAISSRRFISLVVWQKIRSEEETPSSEL